MVTVLSGFLGPPVFHTGYLPVIIRLLVKTNPYIGAFLARFPMMIMGNLAKNAPMYGLVFTNNLMITGRYPVWNTGGPKNPLNTVTINHITGFPDPTSHMMIMGNLAKNAPMYGLVFTNNLMITGRYPVWNTGGQTSCAFKDVPITSIAKCFATFTFGNNGLIAPPPEFPPATWPDRKSTRLNSSHLVI